MWQKGSNGSGGGGGNANIVDRGTATATVTHGQQTVPVNVTFSQPLSQVPKIYCTPHFTYGSAAYEYGSPDPTSVTTTGFTMRIYQARQNAPLSISIDWIAVIEE